jgi:hypothetical protein
MDPLTAAAAGTAATGGAALPLMIGGAAIAGTAQLVSLLMNAGKADEARAVIQNAVDQYGPEAYGIIERELGGPSALEGLRAETEAPEAVAAQRNALRQLQQVSERGYTPEEESAIRQIQAETAATAASQRAATQEAFARRGLSGGGAERVAAFQTASQAANRAAQQGLDVAANAQRRAFQAMQAQGNLGTNVRQQAYGEAERRAAANEERARLRGQMGANVAMNKANLATGQAGTVYDLATQPGKQVAAIGTTLGTPLISYGADMWKREQKQKKPGEE